MTQNDDEVSSAGGVIEELMVAAARRGEDCWRTSGSPKDLTQRRIFESVQLLQRVRVSRRAFIEEEGDESEVEWETDSEGSGGTHPGGSCKDLHEGVSPGCDPLGPKSFRGLAQVYQPNSRRPFRNPVHTDLPFVSRVIDGVYQLEEWRFFVVGQTTIIGFEAGIFLE